MIETRMAQMGGVEFEYLFLKDVNLETCAGCYVCISRGEEKCPLKDDRDAMEKKLLAADGIILSSPMYVRDVSGLMKNFMDRFAYTDHRPLFYRQKVLTVVNTGGGGPKPALLVLRNALGGSRLLHELGIVTPPWPQTQRAVAKKQQAINRAAEKFYRACVDGSLGSPSMNRYIHFLLMRKLSLACRQQLPADFAFYVEGTDYFNVGISPIKADLAKLIAGILTGIYMAMGMGPGNVAWPPAPEQKSTNTETKRVS